MPTQTRKVSRAERRRRLQASLREDPFLTDEELARRFGVSVQTIRLDRMALGIPEVRERTRAVAQRKFDALRSLGAGEMVGQLEALELGSYAVSVLRTSPEMAFERTGIVKSQYLFAQADSLAIAVVDAEVALTGLANVKFRRPVRAGEEVRSRAQVIRRRGNKYVVLVESFCGEEQAFRGKFVVFALDDLSGPARGEGS